MKGFIVVMEDSRINLRVFRRFFYPLKIKHLGREFTVYSDTKREIEINYNRAEDYGLDDPFNRIKLIKLARATKSLKITQENEYHVTICSNRELYEPEATEIRYIPFDPSRLDSLKDKIKKRRRNIEWENRFSY